MPIAKNYKYGERDSFSSRVRHMAEQWHDCASYNDIDLFYMYGCLFDCVRIYMLKG